MLNLWLILFAVMLFGTALSYLVAARWPRAINLTAFAVVGTGLVVWLALGQQLPQSAQLGDWTQTLFVPSWQWYVDETNWLLSGVLLLVVFSLLLFRAGRLSVPPDRSSSFNWQLNRSEWQPILILALVVAGLSAIWASTLATLMISWTLLAIYWALYLLTAGDKTDDLSSVMQRLFWMLAPLLFASIAAAVKPVGSDLLDMSSWSPAAVVAVFLTIMAQMGIMPFVGWRPRISRWMPADGPVLYLIPPVVGAGLLVRLIATAHIEPGAILLLTIFALISILSGVRRAWADLRSTARLPADLTLSLSGLVFLAAIWAGSEALLAGVQLLVFALIVLFLLEDLPVSRVRWWRALAPAVALLALARFPLTAGFITLTSVYTEWQTNSLLLPVLALVLLSIPLITAVLVFVRDHIDTKPAANHQNRSVTMEVAQLLLAAGLLMLGGMPWGSIHIAAWLALLVTAAGALLLSRYVGEVQEAVSTVDAALSPDKIPLARYGPSAQKFTPQVMFTLSEAALFWKGTGVFCGWRLFWPFFFSQFRVNIF